MRNDSRLVAFSLLLCSSTARAQTSEPVATPTPIVNIPAPSAPAGGRPEGLTFGLGAGFAMPQGNFAPNVVSARLRLGSGLTLEPIIIGSFDQQTDENDIGGVVVITETNATELTLAVGVRYPVASRGPVDFVVLGVPAINFNKVTIDPDGDNNNITTSSRAILVDWGIGLEWFIRPKFSTSFNALNPLLVVNAVEVNDEAGAVILNNNEILVGAIFAPVIQVLFHLYF